MLRKSVIGLFQNYRFPGNSGPAMLSQIESEATLLRTKTKHLLGQALVHLAALVVATGAAAAAITFFTGEMKAYPFAFVVILVPAAILGIPTYLAIRDANRVNWKSAVVAGFVVGAIIPAIMIFSGPSADQASIGSVATVVDGSYTVAGWRQNVMFVGGLGLLGSFGALTFWFSIKYLRSTKNSPQGTASQAQPPTRRGVALGFVALATIGAVIAIPEITRDRTCHNPLRSGDNSIAPVAGFDLKVGPDQWERAEKIIRTFGTEGDWSILSDVRPADDFKWFQMSLCRELGTQISVNGIVAFGTVGITIVQPQGGESWRGPFAELLRRIESEWPQSVEFQGPQGQKVTRPGWAPAAPKLLERHPRRPSSRHPLPQT
jgi:hypothetical protein